MDAGVISRGSDNDNHFNLIYEASLKFYPSFLSVFLFFGIGYLAGRLNILPTGRGRSVLSSYIFNIALPAGIMYNVTTSDKNLDVLYDFLMSVAALKSILFIAVIVIGFLIIRNTNTNWGVVFLLAQSVIHSNDFGIGQPLLHAIFDNSTCNIAKRFPEYVDFSMILTFGFFAPITIFALELRRNRDLSLRWGKSIIFAVLKCLLQPVVIAAYLGLIIRVIVMSSNPKDARDNALYDGYTKWIGDHVFLQLTATISPIYLIYTGLALVGTVKDIVNSKQIIIIISVVVIKLIVSPMILKLIEMLVVGKADFADSLSVMMYLYGSLPTSPAVVVFASEYGLLTPTLAIVVLSSTICFAPVSTVSLSVYYIAWCDLLSEQTQQIVHTTIEGVGYTAAVIVVWVVLVLFFISKYRFSIYRMLICQGLALIVYTMLCANVQLPKVTNPTELKGVAFGKAAAEALYCIFGCGMLFFLGFSKYPRYVEKVDRYISAYITSSTLLAMISLAVTCFPFTISRRQRNDYIWDFFDCISSVFVGCRILLLLAALLFGVAHTILRCFPSVSDRVSARYQRAGYNILDETSDVSTDLIEYHNDKMGRSNENVCDLTDREKGKFQVLGFLTVNMTLIAMGMNITSICQHFFRSFSGLNSGKFFLGAVLLYENLWFLNALMIVFIFGTPISEVRDKVLKIKAWAWEKLIQEEEQALPNLKSLSPETIVLCQKFLRYHKSACIHSIGQSVNGSFGRVMDDVFTGERLVDWLINVGLAHDRVDGSELCTKLLLGRVIEHIDKKKNFHDSPNLYKFTDNQLWSGATSTMRDDTIDNDITADSYEFEINRRQQRPLPDWF